jgi:exodeoxyribonuclease VII large subunit
LATALARLLDERRLRVEGLGRGLPEPRSILETAAQRLDDRAERLSLSLRRFIDLQRQRLSSFGDRLRGGTLQTQITQARERMNSLTERLSHAMIRALAREEERVKALGGRLDSHNQALRNVLARGYALVWGADGKPLVSAEAVVPGAALTIEFHDGKVGVTAEGAPRKKPRGSKSDGPKSAGPGPGQGSLL